MAEGSRGPSVPFARLTGKEKKPSVFKMWRFDATNHLEEKLQRAPQTPQQQLAELGRTLEPGSLAQEDFMLQLMMPGGWQESAISEAADIRAMSNEDMEPNLAFRQAALTTPEECLHAGRLGVLARGQPRH